MVLSDPSRSVNDKKRNGKFYTPDPATQLLCGWAIRSREDSVLEPSFGGCGFLVAARDQLTKLGSAVPHEHLFGCDIDPEAFSILDRTLGSNYSRRNFVSGDFLALGRGSYPRERFTVLVGNPPYVSHHNMLLEQRERARAASTVAELNAKASLWAYFVLHGTSFVEQGGRAAWVLPGSFLYSEYAAIVRNVLQRSFGRCLAIELKERLFLTEGTEETTVLVLCESRQDVERPTPIQYAFCDDLASAERAIRCWDEGSFSGVALDGKPRLLSLSTEQQEVYVRFLSRTDTVRFGAYASCRIGVVTGCNKFFLIRPSEAADHNLSASDYRHALGKFRECVGLTLTDEDVSRRIVSDERCLLVSSYPGLTMSETLQTYLGTFPEEKRNNNKTFAKRTEWHATDDQRCPDAFFPIMQNEGPRVVINAAGVNATNSVYRLYQHGSCDLRALALAVLSTFSQLGAEIEGRSYGSGGLKMEPSDVLRLPVRALESIDQERLDSEFRHVHSLLLAGHRREARRRVDELLFPGEFRESALLDMALKETRNRRQRTSTPPRDYAGRCSY